MTAFFVHGWRSRGGYMDRLLMHVRAYEIPSRAIKYGRTFWRWTTEARSFDAMVQLLKVVEPGDAVIAHSNGANIVHDALRCGLKAKTCVFLSPALDEDFDTGDYSSELEAIHVWHTKKDWATRFARFVPSSDWGSAGAHGYQGNDLRVINRDHTDTIGGHSDWFRDCHRLAGQIKEVIL